VEYKIKLIIDKFFAVILLCILSPFFLIICLAIKISDKGPSFFKQDRLGYMGSVFKIYKFRTMKTNAEDIRNPDGSTFNIENDPRLTKLGRFLRNYSIDELPQIINVLKGEMSFIGPRPDLPEFISKYNNYQKQKLYAYPGITGLAQINGRNELPLYKRWEFDVNYVKNYSIKLDLKILFITIINVVYKKGIYIKR